MENVIRTLLHHKTMLHGLLRLFRGQATTYTRLGVHFNSVVSMVIAHPLKELKIGVKRASVMGSAHAYKHLSQLLSGVDQGERYYNSFNI